MQLLLHVAHAWAWLPFKTLCVSECGIAIFSRPTTLSEARSWSLHCVQGHFGRDQPMHSSTCSDGCFQRPWSQIPFVSWSILTSNSILLSHHPNGVSQHLQRPAQKSDWASGIVSSFAPLVIVDASPFNSSWLTAKVTKFHVAKGVWCVRSFKLDLISSEFTGFQRVISICWHSNEFKEFKQLSQSVTGDKQCLLVNPKSSYFLRQGDASCM